LVTVKRQDGEVVRVHVDPQVRNLSNLTQGDQVTVTYSEALALALAKGSDDNVRERVESQAATQAPAGGKPEVRSRAHTTVVANVQAVDRATGLVTLRGTGDQPLRVRVQDPQTLQDIDQGDQVVVSYVEAVAVDIAPPAAGGS